MTPHIDALFRKWTFYKRCLVTAVVLNVFSVSTSLVLGIYFFTQKSDLGVEQEMNLSQVNSIDQIREEIQMITNSQAIIVKKNWLSPENQKNLFSTIEKWHGIKAQLQNLAITAESVEFSDALGLEPYSASRMAELDIKLKTLREQKLLSLKQNLNRFYDLSSVLIWVGALTVVFGFILPLLTIYALSRTVNHIRQELQKAVFDFIKDFTKTKLGFGDEAFKNPEFWLQILLLASQSASHFSSHPAVHILGETAQIIRLELQRKSSNSSAA